MNSICRAQNEFEFKVFKMYDKIVFKIILERERTAETSLLRKRAGFFNPFSFTCLIVAQKNIRTFSPNFRKRQEESLTVIASQYVSVGKKVGQYVLVFAHVSLFLNEKQEVS